MIPAFDDAGNLPPGIHDATLAEIEEHFGGNDVRDLLLAGLRLALADLRRAGCRTAYLDGSFITNKSGPNDFDGCWDAETVNALDLHPALMRWAPPRSAQKARYGGEMLPAHVRVEAFGPDYLAFFQYDRRRRVAKGIIRIDLREDAP